MSLKKTVVASLAGLSLLVGFEGYREYAYTPVEGDRLTIGFGHTGGVRSGDKTSLTDALHLLETDVAFAERAVSKYVRVPLKQNQVDALVSFIYNVGEANFASSTLLRCINAGNESCVDEQWMRWKYFNKRVLPGLERRRAIELAVYRGKSIQQTGRADICVPSVGCLDASDMAVERPSGVGEADSRATN